MQIKVVFRFNLGGIPAINFIDESQIPVARPTSPIMNPMSKRKSASKGLGISIGDASLNIDQAGQSNLKSPLDRPSLNPSPNIRVRRHTAMRNTVDPKPAVQYVTKIINGVACVVIPFPPQAVLSGRTPKGQADGTTDARRKAHVNEGNTTSTKMLISFSDDLDTLQSPTTNSPVNLKFVAPKRHSSDPSHAAKSDMRLPFRIERRPGSVKLVLSETGFEKLESETYHVAQTDISLEDDIDSKMYSYVREKRLPKPIAKRIAVTEVDGVYRPQSARKPKERDRAHSVTANTQQTKAADSFPVSSLQLMRNNLQYTLDYQSSMQNSGSLLSKARIRLKKYKDSNTPWSTLQLFKSDDLLISPMGSGECANQFKMAANEGDFAPMEAEVEANVAAAAALKRQVLDAHDDNAAIALEIEQYKKNAKSVSFL